MDIKLGALEARERFLSMDTSRSVYQSLRFVCLPFRSSKAQTDLSTVLEERGSNDNLRTKFPTDRKPYTSDYDYEDDSDLEGDEDDDTSDSEDVDEPAVAPQAQVATEKSSGDAKLVTVENSDATSNGSSDIISISDADSLFSLPPDTKGETNPTSSAHIGKVVVIEDVAFVT